MPLTKYKHEVKNKYRLLGGTYLFACFPYISHLFEVLEPVQQSPTKYQKLE
jgi:hypothetical protein